MRVDGLAILTEITSTIGTAIPFALYVIHATIA